jgi:hypothetical protein
MNEQMNEYGAMMTSRKTRVLGVGVGAMMIGEPTCLE